MNARNKAFSRPPKDFSADQSHDRLLTTRRFSVALLGLAIECVSQRSSVTSRARLLTLLRASIVLTVKSNSAVMSRASGFATRLPQYFPESGLYSHQVRAVLSVRGIERSYRLEYLKRLAVALNRSGYIAQLYFQHKADHVMSIT